jgi:CHAD domain-containing protein
MHDQLQTPSPHSAAAPKPGYVLFDYAASELARAINCLGWRGARLHTGIHQARKSLRRTRATLALGVPQLGPGAALIDRELRAMNQRLSKLRDAHAFVVALDALLEKSEVAATTAVLRRLRRIAAAERAALARSTLQDDPQLAGKRALLTTLQAALPALPWNVVQQTDVDAALTRSVLDLDAAGARALASTRDVDWHRWRRRARRWSQQQRALGDQPGAHEPAQRHGRRLAIVLGEAQDHALILAHCGKCSPFADADRRVLRDLAKQAQLGLRERIVRKVEAFSQTRQPPEATSAAHAAAATSDDGVAALPSPLPKRY